MITTDLFESQQLCPECGGPAFSDLILAEKKDACYSKVRSRYKVWPSAYASGALVQCRKKGAANWGNKSESVAEGSDMCHVCGQTPCNCTYITESVGGNIKALYQKIANQGDDAIEFMYYDSPIFAQYWDEYEGDLDSIIAEVDPQELQIILDELQSAAEDQGIAENHDNGEYSDEAGMAHGNLITIAKAARGLLDTIDQHEDLPEWVQEKIAKVEGMLVSAWNYLQSQEAQGIDPRITEVYGTLAEAWSHVRNRMELVEEFDIIERVVEGLAVHNGVAAEAIWEDLESLTDDELYVFAVTTPIMEDWQKVNKRDKTDGMSRKAVKAYRREHPGSKLKTAVTTKPSKLKKGSKASKRRKSYCSRSRGQMKMHNISCSKTPDKAICKARRRWNCESMEHSGTMVAEAGSPAQQAAIAIAMKKAHKKPKSEGVTEMDKSQPSHGRDGRISHSTYGSRDRGGSQGQDRTARMTTADRMMKDAEKKFLKHMSNADKVKKGWRNPNIDEQGVAEGYDGSEPLDLNSKPSVNDIFKRALYIHDYEGYGNNMDYSEDEAIDQYLERTYGPDMVEKLNRARHQSYFGRDDGRGSGHLRSSNLGSAGAKPGQFRTTKAGVMHKQDARLAKDKIKDRLGRHPAPALPENVNEVSDATLTSYLTKVDADSQKHEKDPSKRSPAKRNKSVQGFSRAFNKLDARKEKVDEISKQKLGDYLHAAHQDVVDRASSASFQSGQAGDKYNRADATAKDQKREQGMARAVSRLTKEGLADEFMKMAQAKGYNARLQGTPDEERERTQQMLAQRAQERGEEEKRVGQEDLKIIDQLKDQYQQLLARYQSLGGSNWQYADREQNLSSSEREARSMEPSLNQLRSRIARAEKHKDQPQEQAGLGFGEGHNEKIGGRYEPDDFDVMVKRLGQRAREQEQTRPVDVQDLARRLRAIEQSKDDK